jgi:hypothetical protein
VRLTVRVPDLKVPVTLTGAAASTASSDALHRTARAGTAEANVREIEPLELLTPLGPTAVPVHTLVADGLIVKRMVSVLVTPAAVAVTVAVVTVATDAGGV